jgi:hypothetical protein
MATILHDNSDNESDYEFSSSSFDTLEVLSIGTHNKTPILQSDMDSSLDQLVSRFSNQCDNLLAGGQEMGSDWVYKHSPSPDEVLPTESSRPCGNTTMSLSIDARRRDLDVYHPLPLPT